MALNRYSGNGVEQTLEQYIPLPFEELFKGAAAIQQRGDLAEQQREQVEVGLSSLETLASGHTDFKNKFVNDWRKEGLELLKKYPNPSDPDYIRESRKLNLKFASDPRLQTIKQTNEFLKAQQEDARKLNITGTKYIDPNKGFTGVDQQGNLIVPTQNLRQVNYDKIIGERLDEAAKGMEQRGMKISNEWNIKGTNQSLKQQILSDPDLIDGVKYYMQQGLTQEQAIKTIGNYIDNVSTSRISSKNDYSLLEMQQRERFHNDDMNFKKQSLRASQSNRNNKTDNQPIRPRIEDRNSNDINSFTSDSRTSKAIVTGGSTIYDPNKGKEQTVNLNNALILNDNGTASKGSVKENTVVNNGRVKVLVGKDGNVFNSPGKGELNKNNNTYTKIDKNGKKTVIQLRSVAATEYYDRKNKRLIYQPLTKEESLVSGFNYQDTYDYKPIVSFVNNKTSINYSDINNINRFLKDLNPNDPGVVDTYNRFNNAYNKLKLNNTKSNLSSTEIKENIELLNGIQTDIYDVYIKDQLQRNFNITSVGNKQAQSNISNDNQGVIKNTGTNLNTETDQ